MGFPSPSPTLTASAKGCAGREGFLAGLSYIIVSNRTSDAFTHKQLRRNSYLCKIFRSGDSQAILLDERLLTCLFDGLLRGKSEKGKQSWNCPPFLLTKNWNDCQLVCYDFMRGFMTNLDEIRTRVR